MPCRLFDMRLRERREALLAAPTPANLSWDAGVIQFLTDRVSHPHTLEQSVKNLNALLGDYSWTVLVSFSWD